MMSPVRIARWVAWNLVGLFAFIALAVGLGYVQTEHLGSKPIVQATGRPAIGGAFSMTNHLGQRVTEKDFAGKAQLVFFGFTHCPDVCPTTLVEISAWMEALGRDADRLQPIFVTVDPVRDSPEALKSYLESFDPRIIALTGTPEEVSGMVKAYKAHAAKVPTGGDSYAMEHTSRVYLMQADGTFMGTIDRHEEPGAALMKLRQLLEKSPTA